MKFYILIWVGVVSTSFAAIFIRLADAPPPLISALRMAFSSILLFPFAMGSKEFRRTARLLSGRDIFLILLAGFFLSLHFIFWISSLFLTGVASSVVFVTTNPLFVALYTVIIFKERVSAIFWIGLSAAILGGLILGGEDILGGGGRWKGDLLALAGAVAGAGYYLVGSTLRKRLCLMTYIFPVYSTAAVILVVFTIALDIPFRGHGTRVYLYCFLMALLCQVLGHSLFNWAFKHIKATVVTLGTVGEPVSASILAFLILREAPVVTEIIGGILILSGIFLVLYFNTENAGTETGYRSGL